MKKPNRLRWISFDEQLPPLGIAVEIKKFRSWSSKEAYRVVIHELDTLGGGSLVGIKTIGQRGPRKGLITSWSEYRGEACWRYASGTIPGAANIARAKNTAERLCASLAAQDKRRKSRHLRTVRSAIEKEMKEQARLDNLPVPKSLVPKGNSPKVHYKRFPEVWQLQSDPYRQPAPSCGQLEGGTMTLDKRLVTCKKCLRSLQAYARPVIISVHLKAA